MQCARRMRAKQARRWRTSSLKIATFRPYTEWWVAQRFPEDARVSLGVVCVRARARSRPPRRPGAGGWASLSQRDGGDRPRLRGPTNALPWALRRDGYRRTRGGDQANDGKTAVSELTASDPSLEARTRPYVKCENRVKGAHRLKTSVTDGQHRRSEVTVTNPSAVTRASLREYAARQRELHRQATPTLAAGMVASLARPGGMMTGLSYQGIELNTKRLQLLKTEVTRVRVLVQKEHPLRDLMVQNGLGALPAPSLSMRADASTLFTGGSTK